jgi:hypothetical protein
MTFYKIKPESCYGKRKVPHSAFEGLLIFRNRISEELTGFILDPSDG